jgi:hypothetical protein
MANLSKLRPSRLGKPPEAKEASRNLDAPEHAPAAHAPADASAGEYIRKDWRSARKTNRTIQFNTRVSPDWDSKVRRLAERDGVSMAEVLERAIAAYERELQ